VPDPPTRVDLQRLCGRDVSATLQRHIESPRRRGRENAHGNRAVFLSDVFVARPLAFHLPSVRSLRTLEALRPTAPAQAMRAADALPRSTLSDANKVLDPAPLAPLTTELVARVDSRAREEPGRTPPNGLDAMLRRLIAVDGTFLRVVGKLPWALRQHVDCRGRGGAAVRKVVSKPRLDVQLDVAAGVPRFAVLGGQERRECNAARLCIEPDKIYIADKAYFSFALLGAWLDAGADFVVALDRRINFTPDDATRGAAKARERPTPPRRTPDLDPRSPPHPAPTKKPPKCRTPLTVRGRRSWGDPGARSEFMTN